MIVEAFLAKVVLGKLLGAGAAKVAAGAAGKIMLAQTASDVFDAATSGSALADGLNGHGNPPTDIWGGQPTDIHGNPNNGTIHGGRPTDGWGRPT